MALAAALVCSPGAARADPPAGGILLHWRQVRPFGIERSDQFRSAPPPLASRRYAQDYAEVRSVGDAASLERPPDRADVARFYNVALAVAAGNPAVRQVAASRGATIAEKRPHVRAAEHGDQRRPRVGDGDEVPLSLLAPAHRHPPRRGGRQREDGGGSRLRAVRPDPVLPQLSLRARVRELRRTSGGRTHLRRAALRHH